MREDGEAAMLTKQQLEEIKERAEKATKGPWAEDERYPGKVYCDDVFGSIVADCGPFQYCTMEKEKIEANVAFVAHAPTDVPALLAEVERLRERIEKLEQIKKVALYIWNNINMPGDVDIALIGALAAYRALDPPM